VFFFLRLAKSGDRSTHMPAQADILMERLKEEHLCDWNNDWKVITFFVGVSSIIQTGFFFYIKTFL